MYRLLLKPKAIETLREAYIWYEEQQIGLGDRFIEEIEHCYDLLKLQPDIFRKIRKNYRQVVCSVFPYVIVYEIAGLEVIIYVVFHTSLNPKKKFKF